MSVTEVPALCLSSRELGRPVPVSSPTRVSSLRAALAPALPGVLQAFQERLVSLEFERI